MKATIRKASYVLSVFLIGLVGIVLFSALPIEGNYKFKIVNAGSMEPTLRKGTLIMVRPSSVYEREDIITFENGRTAEGPVYVTHRVMDVKVVEGAYQYVTKGDANFYPDVEPVDHAKILGRVIFHVPYVENVGRFVTSPGGFFILIIIPGIGIIFEEWHRKAGKQLVNEQEGSH